MTNNQAKIEEVADEIVAFQGIPKDEAVQLVGSVVFAFESLAELLNPVIKKMMQVWSAIREKIQELYDCTRNRPFDKKIKQPIIWDTRRKSQVILNKPRYMVRKIIW